MGAQVEVVPAYRTVRPHHNTANVRKMFERGAINMVTFTSSSTVNNFVEMFKADVRELRKWMTAVAVACIGPITAETAQKYGFTVSLTPPEYTIESLTDSIVQYFSSH